MFVSIKVTDKEPAPLVNLSSLYEIIINTECVESVSRYKSSFLIKLKNNEHRYFANEKEAKILLKSIGFDMSRWQ